MKHKVYISRSRRGLGCLKAYRLICLAVKAALDAEGISAPCEVSVLLSDDRGLRELNRGFRGLDKPTDVLSFPAFEFAAGAFAADLAEINPESGRIGLGDIAISLERAGEQAIEYGSTIEKEISYLTVHSVLHLLGYDHTDEAEGKRRMRAREKLIMRGLDV